MNQKLSKTSIGDGGVLEIKNPSVFLRKNNLSVESVGRVKCLAKNFQMEVFDLLNEEETRFFLVLKNYEFVNSTLDSDPKFLKIFDKSLEHKCAIENSKEGLSDFFKNPRDGFFLVENLDSQIVGQIKVYEDFNAAVLGKQIKDFLNDTDVILPKFVFQGLGEDVPKSESDIFNIESLRSWVLDFEKIFDKDKASIIAENIWKIWKFKQKSFSLDVGKKRSKSMRLDENDLSSFENLFSIIQKSAVLNIFVKKGLSIKKIT